MKRFVAWMGIALFASALRAGVWTVEVDKTTGARVARLRDGSRIAKEIVLVSTREIVPAGEGEKRDGKLVALAQQLGVPLTRWVGRDVSADALSDGALLLLQEQTIVMPPFPNDAKDEHRDRLKAWALRTPDENNVVVTLLDERGNTIWTRRFGPLAGLRSTRRTSDEKTPLTLPLPDETAPPAVVPSTAPAR
jgi:hypothetical protein